jgi:hypothetical protein
LCLRKQVTGIQNRDNIVDSRLRGNDTKTKLVGRVLARAVILTIRQKSVYASCDKNPAGNKLLLWSGVENDIISSEATSDLSCSFGPDLDIIGRIFMSFAEYNVISNKFL